MNLHTTYFINLIHDCALAMSQDIMRADNMQMSHVSDMYSLQFSIIYRQRNISLHDRGRSILGEYECSWDNKQGETADDLHCAFIVTIIIMYTYLYNIYSTSCKDRYMYTVTAGEVHSQQYYEYLLINNTTQSKCNTRGIYRIAMQPNFTKRYMSKTTFIKGSKFFTSWTFMEEKKVLVMSVSNWSNTVAFVQMVHHWYKINAVIASTVSDDLCAGE